jgi:hypothetical protein
MFYPGSISEHFIIPDPDPLPIKRGITNKNYRVLFFMLLLEKVLIVKKIINPGSPDPGGKKSLHPVSGSKHFSPRFPDPT